MSKFVSFATDSAGLNGVADGSNPDTKQKVLKAIRICDPDQLEFNPALSSLHADLSNNEVQSTLACFIRANIVF
jgi:hypothetical protein